MPTLEQISLELESPCCLGVTPDQINNTFREWSKVCHPDLNPGNAVAGAVFRKLVRLKEIALRPGFTMKVGGVEYQCHQQLATGDVSTVYDATRGGAHPLSCVVKLSRFPGASRFLKQEVMSLNKLAGGENNDHYAKMLPALLCSHEFRDQKRVPHQINVFARVPRLFTLYALRAKHGSHLDGRHLAWIFNRITETLGYVHSCNLLHGAITPDHVLIDAKNHGIVLLGWGQSTTIGSPITAISKRHECLYPREVKAKQPAGTQTDIYMLGMLMTWLADGLDVPYEILLFWRSLLIDGQFRRPNSAWKLRDEFRDVLRNVYGAPRFVTLEM